MRRQEPLKIDISDAGLVVLDAAQLEQWCRGQPETPINERPEYQIWSGMIQRCANPESGRFEYYGGRGISVCERWKASFKNFLADMGPRPSPLHSIDREDNGGNYEPDNCRWATNSEQSRNKRNNVWLTHNGETMIVADWAPRVGLPPTTIAARIRLGWDAARALTTPANKSLARPGKRRCLACGEPGHTRRTCALTRAA